MEIFYLKKEYYIIKRNVDRLTDEASCSYW